MKKVIIACLLGMMLLPCKAGAQIVVTGKSQAETITSIRMGFIRLNYDGEYYLSMSTTNQFDDRMVISLGKDKKEAAQTMQSLLDIVTGIKKGECVRIRNTAGEEFRIYRFAKKSITIHSDGYAAASNMSVREAEALLEGVLYDVR